jgi:chemotaxis protein methyltransferase CheR
VSAEFAFLSQFLKQRSGLDLTPEKQYLLESRLRPVARKHGLDGLSALVAGLKQGGNRALMDEVVEAMTTNESFFFRDKTPFDQFRETIMPDLVESRAVQRKLRIWCAAASTGQEPYSLAMELREMQARLSNWSVDIIGTDLSPQVLEKAKAGLYSQFEVQRGLPVQMLVKYFEQKGEMWQVVPQIRAMAEYRVQNLLEDFSSLGRFDVVFCRNVLIYFDPPTKADVLSRIRKLLPADGYLLLGASETIIGLTDDFELVQGSRGLYRPKEAMQSAAPKMVAAGGGAVSAIAAPRPNAGSAPSTRPPATPARPSTGPGTAAPVRPVATGATNLAGRPTRSSAPSPTTTPGTTPPSRPAGLVQAGAPIRPQTPARPDAPKNIGTPRPAPTRVATSATPPGAATTTPKSGFAPRPAGALGTNVQANRPAGAGSASGAGASKVTPLNPAGARPRVGAAPARPAGGSNGTLSSLPQKPADRPGVSPRPTAPAPSGSTGPTPPTRPLR